MAVLVGYNNARLDELDARRSRRCAEATGRFDCGVWLTLPARPGGEESTYPDISSDELDRWNDRLAAVVGEHPNLHLADDWADAVDEAPAGSLLKPDGLHPNAAGQRRLADAYRSALDRLC